MTTPSSSGEAGPTPISREADQGFVGEQVRPSFSFGGHELRLADRVTAWHRERKMLVVGRLIVLHGSLCVSCADHGIYPLAKLQIREVQPPIFE